MHVAFMDLYTIARVFRKYKNIDGQVSDRARNIIIYTGDWHTRNYVNFLEGIGCKRKFWNRAKEEQNQIVDVRNMIQPLFIE